MASWIKTNEGDEIVFQPGDVILPSDFNEDGNRDGWRDSASGANKTLDPDWWLKFVKERLSREAPLPPEQNEREVILFRVVNDLFGASPSTAEAELFHSDQSSEALIPPMRTTPTRMKPAGSSEPSRVRKVDSR